MKSLRKIGAIVLAVAMLASSTSAFACANDKFINYDQIPDELGRYAKLYKCPEADKIVVNGYAKKAEWKHAFYEAEYPHREIEVLYLDDVNTGLTRFDLKYAEVNTKEVPEFWEAKAPYFIYNRVYSDFTGAYKPTNVLKTEYKTAPVAKDWVKKGFDKYVVENGKVYDYSHVYGENVDKIDFSWNAIEDLEVAYWTAVEADKDAFLKGEAKAAYEIFEDAINEVSWLELEGPDYANGGTGKFFPFAKIAEGNNAEWYDELLVSDNYKTVDGALMNHLNLSYEAPYADVEWVTVGYELTAPYRYYQVLSINGVLMDGSEVDVVGYEVKKEEVVEVKKDYADEIHVIEKPIEAVGYTSSANYDYVIRPFDTETTKTIKEHTEYKVVEDDDKEIVKDKIKMQPIDDQYEIRFVKVSTEPGKSRLPYIWRYTGGYGNPKVEWKVAFAEAAAPYEIYEEKIVDGIATGVLRSTGRYAEENINVSTDTSMPRVLTVILEDNVNVPELKWALEDVGYEFIIMGNRLNVILPAELYPGHYDAWTAEVDNLIKISTINVEQ